MSTFDLAAHQRERIRHLDARVTMLEAEERRLYRLLALALTAASTEPLTLLTRLCQLDGTHPARPAWMEEKKTEKLVQVLRDTAPREQKEAA